MISIWEVKTPCACDPKNKPQISIEKYKCDCCGRFCSEKNELRIKRFGAWLIGVDQDMCFDCFSEWYSNGETDPKKIKKSVLKRTT